MRLTILGKGVDLGFDEILWLLFIGVVSFRVNSLAMSAGAMSNAVVGSEISLGFYIGCCMKFVLNEGLVRISSVICEYTTLIETSSQLQWYRGQTEDIYQPQDEDGNSDYCQSEESYHSYIGSDTEDEITNHEAKTYLDNSKVKKFSDSHTCIQSNKGGNKCATQRWIASVIKDKLKSDGDVSVTKLKKWLIKNYNVKDHITMIDAFKEEIRNKNPGSIVDTDFEISDDKKLAYGVLESENTKSWSWFLKLLKESIGTPDGLVISSDMQKGLEAAIPEVYLNV
nr:hypothetical protein [Tanacetum cinerariifolium]